MKTLLTGASGFLGHYILENLPQPVLKLGRSKANDIKCDLAFEVPDLPEVDLVIHSAGLAHRIPKNPDEEKEFYQVNLFGTDNLIKGLNKSKSLPKAFVLISSVAVYGLETGHMISEKVVPVPLTPYGKSKHEAELLVQKWARENGINLTILRLPLVAGAKDTPGNLGAMIKAIQRGYYFRVGDGKSRKSMVLAQDISRLIPTLINHSGVYNLTDGFHPGIAGLDTYIADHFGKKIRSIPSSLLKMISYIGTLIPSFPLNPYRLAKLSESLTFDDSKARKDLDWNPRPVIGNLDF